MGSVDHLHVPRAELLTSPLVTVGHGTHDHHGLGDLPTDAGVDLVVGVRCFPDSRTYPDLRRDWPAPGPDLRTRPLPAAEGGECADLAGAQDMCG